MGDLIRCKSSLLRPSPPPADACWLALANVSGAPPGTIISGAYPLRDCCNTTPLDGLRKRIRRSPREYSNSSRLCSVMNCNSCSICFNSRFAKLSVALLATCLEVFLRVMRSSNLDEIPRNAGQHFYPIGVHRHIIFNAYPAHALDIDSRFNGHHVPRF